MRELIFNILIFTIVTSVLKCLIIKEEYKQYFQFYQYLHGYYTEAGA